MKFHKLYFLLFAVGLGLVTSGGVSAQIAVDKDGMASFNNCNATTATYSSIQTAITAAPAGTTIRVCPGTYFEQLTVGTGKNNLTLISTQTQGAIIQAPPVMTGAGDLITVNAARNITISGFKIAGPLPDALFCSVSIRSGVRVIGNGSANILRNRITEIRSANPALRGCQNGIAIAVGRKFETQTGQANISDNTIDKFQKGGIYVDNAGSNADVEHNEIIGEGAQNVIGQNGIQIGRGATATVNENHVTGIVYVTPPAGAPTSGTAILIFESAGVSAEGNRLDHNQDGFGVYTEDNLVTLKNNRITGPIPAFPATLGTAFFGDGVFMDVDTARNVIKNNFMRNNNEHDCHDESTGTFNSPANVANQWKNDNGVTQNKVGLCRAGDDDDGDDDDDKGDDGDHGHGDHAIGNFNVPLFAAAATPRRYSPF